ncbi:MAG: SUMF1/EgtB/PvdO family nonheme iron enzyme, partial [Planctomycetes bacterium]|nr:SUMF1/EgtB/PvdO family nonheme iron enzyme [Planctomycetota bacterium]
MVQSLRTWTEQHGHATEPGRREAARPPAVTDRSRRDSYLQQIRAQHSQLPLIGFPKTVRIDIPLEDLYVPLHAVPSAEEKRLAYGAAEEAYAHENLRGAEPCTSLAVVFSMASRRGNRRGFVLLGDPGAGKTTHLRRMALVCAMPDKGPRELGLPDDVLPLFLPLRLLKDDDDLDTVLPLLLARSLEVDLNRAQDILRSGSRWLFLFDGLDEVPKRFRDGVARWIERLLTSYRDSWFGVTCRYAGYADDCRLDAHFLELHLRPLRDEAIAQFVHNWYRIVERQAGPQDGADPVRRAADHAKDLIERLTHASVASRRVEELAANPLLLTIICLVHRDRGRILPDSRIDLYQDCMAVLLERWREAKGIDATWTAKEAQQILQPLALQLHEAETTRLPYAELAPTAAQAIRALHPESATSGAEFLAQIRDESGVLVGWSNDQFGFLHLGFQEHLAAKAIADSIVSAALQQRANPWLDRLAAKFGDSWWEEVLLLLLAREDASLFVPLFERIVRQPQFAEHGSLLQSCLREAKRRDTAPFEALLRSPRLGWLARMWGRVSAPTATRIRRQEATRAVAVSAIAAIRSDMDLAAIGKSGNGVGSRIVKGIEMLQMPAGRFLMGYEFSAEQREVRFARPFWIAKTAVTNAQYRVYVNETNARRPKTWKDRRFSGDNQPVLDVSLDDAREFCAWAGLRLPSEAEWEYSCRAGTTTAFSFGANITPNQVNYDGNYPFGDGAKGAFRKRTVPVGSLPAIAWGLHEMHGNAFDWCENCLHDYDKSPANFSALQEYYGL